MSIVEERGKRDEQGEMSLPVPPAAPWIAPNLAGVCSAWSYRACGRYIPDDAMPMLIAHLSGFVANVVQGASESPKRAEWLAAMWACQGGVTTRATVATEDAVNGGAS